MTRPGCVAGIRGVMGLVGLVGVCLAWPAAGAELSPEQIFGRVSPSVVTVRTFDARGNPLGQGSGVVIAAERVATNCHVIKGAAATRVETATQTVTAGGARMDGNRDVCVVSAAGLSAPPVAAREFGSVSAGERVFAVGNPLGFGLAISEGLLVSVQTQAWDRSLAASAPVSPGSSGGGLFDTQGRLVGLTTAILVTGQSLNLVLPAEGLGQVHLSGKPLAPEGASVPVPEKDWVKEAGMLSSIAYWRGLEAHARQWVSSQPVSAVAHAVLARALWEEGRADEATGALDQALKLDPFLPDAWAQKAVLLNARGEQEAAQDALRQVSRLVPGNPVPSQLKAQWLLQARRYQDAQDEAQRAVRLDAGNSSAWATLGAAEDGLGRHRQAVQAYRTALRLDRPDPALRQRLAQSLAKLGQVEDAKTSAASAGGTGSEAHTWTAIGFAELERKKLGPAHDAFRKAVELASGSSPAWNGLGMALERLQRTSEAEKAFDRAVQLDPTDVQARSNRAIVRHALGQKDPAYQDIRHAIDAAPSNAEFWRVFGRMSFTDGHRQDAATAFGKIDALNQATDDDLIALGESLADVGRVPEGLATLRRVELNSTGSARLFLSMAKVLGNSGDTAQALLYTGRALELEPSNPHAWSGKGYALMRLGRLPEATDVLETAVRLSPDFASAWINLGHAHMRRNNLARAIDSLEKGVALSPQAMDARTYLAQAYMNSRQMAKAREQAAVVLARMPDQPTCLGVLIVTHLMEGDEARALEPFQRLRATHPRAAAEVKAQALRAGLSAASRFAD